jgi:transcription antitermination factor NusA-like protein
LGNAKCDRSPHHHGNSRNFFTIFVDAIFTTLLERLFTNAFDVIGAKSAKIACVARDTPINSLAT